MRKQWLSVQRGVVPVRVVDETRIPARRADEDPAIVGVFGNDNYLCDERARREVEFVRQHLREAEAHELGFGVSQDGYTWAILVQANSREYQTEVGKKFQREMLRAMLDDIVAQAWRAACTND